MVKREKIKIILFLAIFLVLLVSVSYIVRTNGSVKDRFAGFYAEKKNTIDVVMFGASPVATSFSPGYIWKNYGIKTYPLSTNSQRPMAISYLLDEAYKYQDPKVVVIELRMFTYPDQEMAVDEPHIREVTDNMRYSLQRIKTVNALTKELDQKYTYVFDIFKFHSNWKMFFLPKELGKFYYRQYDPRKGFEFSDVIIPQDEGTDVAMNQTMDIPKEQESVLVGLMEQLKENDQKALFIVTPEVNTTEYESMMNKIGGIVEEQGFQFLNLNDHYAEMNFDFSTDMKDGVHTNILGAAKCSDYLGDYLQQTYGIEKDENEQMDQRWEDCYLLFQQEYLAALEKTKQ